MSCDWDRPTFSPVVAMLPTVGWFAVLNRDGDEPLEAVPVEHATVHADGTRVLWREDLKGLTSPLSPGDYAAVVRAEPGARTVEWSPTEHAYVHEESTASWRPDPPA